jgi:hypothetical protein
MRANWRRACKFTHRAQPAQHCAGRAQYVSREVSRIFGPPCCTPALPKR